MKVSVCYWVEWLVKWLLVFEKAVWVLLFVNRKEGNCMLLSKSTHYSLHYLQVVKYSTMKLKLMVVSDIAASMLKREK